MMEDQVPQVVHANLRVGGRWSGERHLLVAPERAVRLGTATRWAKGLDSSLAGTFPDGQQSLTATRSGSSRVVALRTLHFTPAGKPAVVVSAAAVPAGVVVPPPTAELRKALEVPLAALDALSLSFRGAVRTSNVTLVREDGPTTILTLEQRVADRAGRQAVSALLAGRRVAVVADDEVGCAAAICAALRLLSPEHPAHTSWSTLETDGMAGLALVGVVPQLWLDSDPSALGYVRVVARASRPASADRVARSSEALAEGRACPLCARPTLQDRRLVAARGVVLSRQEEAVLASPATRDYRCDSCGLHCSAEAPDPLVLLGPVAGRESGALEAVLDDALAVMGFPLTTAGPSQTIPPWRVTELTWRAGSARQLLALEPITADAWRSQLWALAQERPRGLVVVWVTLGQLEASEEQAAQRPALTRECRRTLEAAGRAVLGSPGWAVVICIEGGARGATASPTASDRRIQNLASLTGLPPTRLQVLEVPVLRTADRGGGALAGIRKWMNGQVPS